MKASDSQLSVDLQAEDAERLERLKDVVASHLERMAGKEPVSVVWQ